MTAAERREHERMRDLPDGFEDDDGYEDDVMRGDVAAETSHAGEFVTEEEAQESDVSLLEQLRAHHNQLFPRTRDRRTRADRTQILVDAFAAQMEAMTDVYLVWKLATAEAGLGAAYLPPEDASVEHTQRILVVDNFSAAYDEIPIIQGDLFVASALVRQGLMPVAPYLPSVVITIRALEVYRVTRLRCPRLGIQAYVRGLCDLHGVPPRPYLATQFTVAFDVYLAILARVERRVLAALSRDTPDWRLRNACPACLYKLEGEEALEIHMLATIDGNNSLKRSWRRNRDDVQEEGPAIPGASKEWLNSRLPAGDYYLSREEVDRWAKEGLEDMMKGFVADEAWVEEEDGCSERWQNMREEVTSRAFGMYDETGFFPALCRHSFVLIVVDMVKSGELAKYGFAVTHHLMCVLGEIGLGYDIGCKYDKMVRAHPGLSKLAADTHFRALVGAFHGSAHKRKCQLKNLTTYVRGVGTEDLETCECFFLKSNALASTTRYATAFHRKQAITTYLKHADTADAYQGLSSVLCSKYRRALRTKATLPALQEAMVQLGVESREVFETWLEKEKAFLQSLSAEPLQETLEMEYYQKLALQVRSKAVKASIDRYNAAAVAMTPPKVTLTWEQVVEYAFLADFDLVREGREDIRAEPWALPAGRAAMDQHYKLLRADEELKRLNVEIRRLVTHIADEEAFLEYHEDRLEEEGNLALAHQVGLYRMERGRFDTLHLVRLGKLSTERGFTGSISPGVSICRERHVRQAVLRRDGSEDVGMRAPAGPAAVVPEGGEDSEDDDEDDSNALAEAFQVLVRMSGDDSRAG
ncbi:hypothetical protein B0H15DRAFT_806803 [Mycena belliarum]|uniref:CxC1-like cysteine cluster associated with KDZ transposases domain-containing protein n=1 Tax=Mycena belliarum TaxID=1033014 RepID=A0AAD6TNZ5_9AGAR|nr:hypothetical protein B0H15DRAFT_806803 [Mycena belliae]